MLVVVDAEDVEEVKEIIGLLLMNKKKSFTVYDDEEDLLKKIFKGDIPLRSEKVQEPAQLEVQQISTPEEASPLLEMESPPLRTPTPTFEPEPAKREYKLNWNFGYHSAPITSDMEDHSEFYINAESSSDDECDEEPKETSEVMKTVLTPYKNKPKRGRPPKTDTPAVIAKREQSLDSIVCEKCKNSVRITSLSVQELSNHAIVHTDLKKYACPIINCDIKARQRSVVAYHIAKFHKMESKGVVIPDILTPEETARLEEVTYECFPDICSD